jgi:hypothetical protein
MIVKITKGKGVSGLHRYVTGRGKDENGQTKPNERARPLGGQNFGFDVYDDRTADIARRMMEYDASPQMQADKNRLCEKDCLHISLSWAPGQSPGDDEKRQAAREVLEALGMGGARAQFWDHNDRSFNHIHINASRINPETGRAYDDYQSRYKGMHWAIQWEKKTTRSPRPVRRTTI